VPDSKLTAQRNTTWRC